MVSGLFKAIEEKGVIMWWRRATLKSSAKELIQKNYWWLVLVTLIFGIVAGKGMSFNFNLNSFGINKNVGFANREFSDLSDNYMEDILNNTYDGDSLYEQFRIIDDMSFSNVFSSYKKIVDTVFGELFGGFSVMNTMIILCLLCIIMIATIVLRAFVTAPFEVGCRRWFLRHRTEDAKAGELVYAFKKGYMNVVKIMFCRTLFTALWSLLLIVPGIVKSYEYRMIPYLLAENPEMSMQEAFGISKEMMLGNKWDTFVLDLSFLGWHFLSALTCGILGIFYVNPYVQLTNTELYVELCNPAMNKDHYNF